MGNFKIGDIEYDIRLARVGKSAIEGSTQKIGSNAGKLGNHRRKIESLNMSIRKHSIANQKASSDREADKFGMGLFGRKRAIGMERVMHAAWKLTLKMGQIDKTAFERSLRLPAPLVVMGIFITARGSIEQRAFDRHKTARSFHCN